MQTSYEHMSREQLLDQVIQLESSYDQLTQNYTTLKETYNKTCRENSYLKFQISELKRLIYGTKRERFVSDEPDGQQKLPFPETEEATSQEAPKEKQKIEYYRAKGRKKHPGRVELPSHLPVQEVRIEPEGSTEGMRQIGEEHTNELEYRPGTLFIKRYIRPKFVHPQKEQVTIGQLPTRPIEKGIAGPGLLAQCSADKYVYHLPIYRQLQRFKWEGIRISASTINGWNKQVCDLLTPLFERLQQMVLQEGYLQVDETPIKVLDKRKKGKTHQGYYWVYFSPIRGAVFFDYRQGRSRDGPRQLLRDFAGYLQTDGYRVYDWFGKQPGITLLGCWAHARRKFEKALDYDRQRASYVMEQIQKLYAIERHARDNGLSCQQRKELRLDQALPIMNALGSQLEVMYRDVLPKSPLGRALEYIIPRWDSLMNYLYDGMLEIDNNLVENAIRPNALGRKNYLFAGSHDGARRGAMFYSFFGTCKQYNVDPWKWLKRVLEIIPDYPANQLADLLPQNLNLD